MSAAKRQGVAGIVGLGIMGWKKDMKVIGDFARALGCPTPLFAATRPVYAAALAAGHAMDDTASVCAVLETKAGVRR